MAYLGLPFLPLFPWKEEEVEWWPLRGTSTERIARSNCKILSVHMPFGESAWRGDLPSMLSATRKDLRTGHFAHLVLMWVLGIGDFWRRVWKPGWVELNTSVIRSDLEKLRPQALLFHADQLEQAMQGPPGGTAAILDLAEELGIAIHVEPPEGAFTKARYLCQHHRWKLVLDTQHTANARDILSSLKELLGEIHIHTEEEGQELLRAFPWLEDVPLVLEPRGVT